MWGQSKCKAHWRNSDQVQGDICAGFKSVPTNNTHIRGRTKKWKDDYCNRILPLTD